MHLNEENLLALALEFQKLLDYPIMGDLDGREQSDGEITSEYIIISYAIEQLSQKGKSFTDSDVAEKANEIVISYILNQLVQSGLVEVEFDNGEIRYSTKE